MPAKLPDYLITKRPPRVGDLEPGAEAFVSIYAIKVDLDRSVYVLRDIDLGTTHEKRVRIRRDEKGAYQLDLDGVDYQFPAQDLEREKKFDLLLPIEFISGMADRK